VRILRGSENRSERRQRRSGQSQLLSDIGAGSGTADVALHCDLRSIYLLAPETCVALGPSQMRPKSNRKL